MADDNLFDVGGELAKQKRAALEIMVNEGVPASAAMERAAATVTKRRDESLAALGGFDSPQSLAQAQAIARRPADAALIALGLEQGVFENQVERRRRALDDLFGGIEATVPLVQAETERAFAESQRSRGGGGGGGGGLSASQVVPLAINQARDRIAQATTIEDPLFQKIQQVAHGENAMAGLESIDAMMAADPRLGPGLARENAANRDVVREAQKLAQMPRDKVSPGDIVTVPPATRAKTRPTAAPSLADIVNQRPKPPTLQERVAADVAEVWPEVDMLASKPSSLAPSVRRAAKEALKRQQQPRTGEWVGTLGPAGVARLQVEDELKAARIEALRVAAENRAQVNAPMLAAFGVQRTNERPGSLANVLPGFTAADIGYDPEFGYFVDPSSAPEIGSAFPTDAFGLVDRTQTTDPATGRVNPVEMGLDPDAFFRDIALMTDAARRRAVEYGLDPAVAEVEITENEVMGRILGDSMDQIELFRDYLDMLSPDLAAEYERNNALTEAQLRAAENERLLDVEAARQAAQAAGLSSGDVEQIIQEGKDAGVEESLALRIRLNPVLWSNIQQAIVELAPEDPNDDTQRTASVIAVLLDVEQDVGSEEFRAGDPSGIVAEAVRKMAKAAANRAYGNG